MNEKQRKFIEQMKARQNLKPEYQQPINMPDERMKPMDTAVEFGLGVSPVNQEKPDALQGVYPGLMGAGILGAGKAGLKAYDALHNKLKRTKNIRDLVVPYQSIKAKEKALPFDEMQIDSRGREIFKTGMDPDQQRVYERLLTNPNITSKTTPRGAYSLMLAENRKLGRIQMESLKKHDNKKIDVGMELRGQIDNRINEAFKMNPALNEAFDANQRQFKVMMNGLNKDIAKVAKDGQVTPRDVEQLRRNLDSRMQNMKGARFTDGEGNETPLYVLWMETRSAMNDLVDRRVGTTLFKERRKAMNDYFKGMEITKGRGARTGATPKQRKEQAKSAKEKAIPMKILGRFRSFMNPN